MGRKSLTEARTAEILDAFARCMVKYGLDTSLEEVAEEAGMTRSIIRHYIGNREEVVNVLIARVTHEYVERLRRESESILQEQMIAATLDYLFSGTPSVDHYDKLIMDVLMTAKERYPQAKGSVLTMFETLTAMFVDDLMRAYPRVGESACRGVAYSIICLAMSNESFLWLGMDQAYNVAARAGAEALLRTLEG